jgi:flagellar motility protein MotE (MotC chaperone)
LFNEMTNNPDDPIFRSINDYLNSPALRSVTDYINSPAFRSITDYINSPAFRSVTDYIDSPAFRSVTDYINSPTFRSIADYINSPAMRCIENIVFQNQRIAREIDGIAGIVAKIPNQTAFAIHITDKVGALQAALSESERTDGEVQLTIEKNFEEIVDELYELLERAVEKVELRSVIRFLEWIIPVILALYLYQDSSIQLENFKDSSHQDDIRILESIRKLDEKIDERIKSENAQRGTFYIVIRPVPLNEGQRFHGLYICWLMPGQEVEVIERSGKWIRVITYDFSTGATHVGWVLKKYLRRIQ